MTVRFKQSVEFTAGDRLSLAVWRLLSINQKPDLPVFEAIQIGYRSVPLETDSEREQPE